MQGKTSTSDGRCATPRRRWSSSATGSGWSPAAGSTCSPTTSCLRTSTRPRAAAGAESPAELLDRFPDGLVTAEVAALIAPGPDYVFDREAAERWLVQGAAAGDVVRIPCGNDAIWRRASAAGARAA